MKALAVAAILAIVGMAYPVHAQTPVQITRESHEANYKKQFGGMKKDRKISRMIKHHERHAYHRHHTHH